VGTEEEFRAFVAARYDALVRSARLMAPDPAQAEDFAQSALVTTFTRWPRLRDPAAAEAYTRTVLTRQCMRAARRRWRGEVPTDVVPERAAGDGYAAVDNADAVRRALTALPVEQRAVLVLRYYADLSEQDIADVLRCSVGTVKSRASRALTALREHGLLDDVLEATDE
jgi:RNA polymerase sigma-70 factor (sigma-E family)